MKQFLSAHAVSDDASELAANCLSQLGTLPPELTLGVIYVTAAAAEQLPQILDALQQAIPQVHWLGSVGEGVCAPGQEYYDRPAISLLLTDIPQEHFCLLPPAEALASQLSEEVKAWAQAHPDSFGLLHAVPTYMATSAYAHEVRRYAPEATINGGLSSGTGNYRHVMDGVESQGISGALISAEQTVLSAHAQGCTPISKSFSIDEAHQNMVLRLNERPALEVLRDVVGEVLWRDKARLSNYIFIGLPADPCLSEDYLVRNLMGIDLEGGAIAVGDMMELHLQMRFCRRDGNAARDAMVDMLQGLKQQVGERTIRGGIYVSCVGRGRRQFGEQSEELKLIQQELGDFPLTGFFANGEFYQGRLYSYTGVLTLFL